MDHTNIPTHPCLETLARNHSIPRHITPSQSTVRRSRLLWIALIMGSLSFILGRASLAQIAPEQSAGLKAVSQMTEAQRTHYRKHQYFLNRVGQFKKDFGISLPTTYHYAVRTTTQAAYTYAIPSESRPGLKAYVGGAFIDLDGQITTIICENTVPGVRRPPRPLVAKEC